MPEITPVVELSKLFMLQGGARITPFQQAFNPRNPLARGVALTREQISSLATEAGVQFTVSKETEQNMFEGAAFSSMLLHLNQVVLWQSKKEILTPTRANKEMITFHKSHTGAMIDWVLVPFISAFNSLATQEKQNTLKEKIKQFTQTFINMEDQGSISGRLKINFERNINKVLEKILNLNGGISDPNAN